MAEITKKRVGELQRGVFQILLNEPEGMRAQDVIKQMRSVVVPTPFELSEYENAPGVVRFDKIIRFATISSVKAGWLIKNKGNWILTDDGRNAYRKFSTPESFNEESNRLYYEWKKGEKPASVSVTMDEEISNNEAQITLEMADEAAWTAIEHYVSSMDPYDVQNHLMVGLLKGMGYHVYWSAPRGADGGIDVLALTDPLGTNGPTIKASVRRREAKADVKELREFISRLHIGDVGVFFSVAGFTKEADKETRSDSRKVRLLDLEQFFDLWVEHYNKIPEVHRRHLPVQPLHFLVTSANK